MPYASRSTRTYALFQVVPQKRAVNPRDVAELFDWLEVNHLGYREFQLPDEPAASELRPNRVSPLPTSSATSRQPVIVRRSRQS